MTRRTPPVERVLRLFFAALPDAGTRDLLAAAAGVLRLGAARLVPPDDYHVTLAFIGEVPESRLPLLLEIGRVQRVASLTLRFDAYEYWPKPEVVVTAARTIPPALQQLWRQLHERLAVQRWALDPKRLRPHVTLARKVSQAPVLQAMSSLEWTANEFSLMSSDTSGSQSAYTVVDTWPLLDSSVKT